MDEINKDKLMEQNINTNIEIYDKELDYSEDESFYEEVNSDENNSILQSQTISSNNDDQQIEELRKDFNNQDMIGLNHQEQPQDQEIFENNEENSKRNHDSFEVNKENYREHDKKLEKVEENQGQNLEKFEIHKQIIKTIQLEQANSENELKSSYTSPRFKTSNHQQTENSQKTMNHFNYDNLEQSFFDCTADNKQTVNLGASQLNMSRINNNQKQTNQFTTSFIPDMFDNHLMTKSHLNFLQGGSSFYLKQKKKKVYTITITSFERIQHHLNSYIVYHINSSWNDTHQEFRQTIKRRFNEFRNLNNYTQKKYINQIQPIFPEPSIKEALIPVIKLIQDDTNLIQDRQKKLENYLQKLAETEFINDDQVFELFLTSQDEFKIEFDEDNKPIEKEEKSIVSSYYNSISGMFTNFKNIIYPQSIPFLSQVDKEHQNRLKKCVEQIQEKVIIIDNLKDMISKIQFDDFEIVLKQGEQITETELTNIDHQALDYQQQFLSYYYKNYPLDQEKDLNSLFYMKTQKLSEILQGALQSYDRYNIRRNQYILKLIEERNQKNQLKHKEENKQAEYDMQQQLSQNISTQPHDEEQQRLTKAAFDLIQQYDDIILNIFPSKLNEIANQVKVAYIKQYQQEENFQEYCYSLIKE